MNYGGHALISLSHEKTQEHATQISEMADFNRRKNKIETKTRSCLLKLKPVRLDCYP